MVSIDKMSLGKLSEEEMLSAKLQFDLLLFDKVFQGNLSLPLDKYPLRGIILKQILFKRIRDQWTVQYTYYDHKWHVWNHQGVMPQFGASLKSHQL